MLHLLVDTSTWLNLSKRRDGQKWYHRSRQREYLLLNEGKEAEAERNYNLAPPGRERVEATYTEPDQLGPYTDFELGMLDGKLSVLRWALGAEWDFLDT